MIMNIMLMYSAEFFDADADGGVINKIYHGKFHHQHQNHHQKNPMLGVLKGGYVVSES